MKIRIPQRPFGVFHDCSIRNYWDAIVETAVTCFFSLLPLVLGLLAALLVQSSHETHVFSNFFGGNEAFMVSAALSGPLVFTISRKYGNLPTSLSFKFPGGLLFFICSIMICVVAGLMFGLSVAFSDVTAGQENYLQHINVNNASTVSKVAIASAILMIFTVSSIRNMLEGGGPPRIMSNGTETYVTDFGKDQNHE